MNHDTMGRSLLSLSVSTTRGPRIGLSPGFIRCFSLASSPSPELFFASRIIDVPWAPEEIFIGS